VVRDRLITGIARGHGELDWMALGLIAAEEAGLYAVPSVADDWCSAARQLSTSVQLGRSRIPVGNA